MAILSVQNAQFQEEQELLFSNCTELLTLAATKASQCITLVHPLIERSQKKLQKYVSLQNTAKIPQALAKLRELNLQIQETRAALTSVCGVITQENLHNGLSGVPLSFCNTSYVDPKKGVFYADISIKELINYSVEEVLFLLENGYLPKPQELNAYTNCLKTAASSPLSSFTVVPCKDPMDSLIATLTHLKIDSNHFEEEILSLKAHLPFIIASVINTHAGWGNTPSYNPSLGYVENFVQMLQMPQKDSKTLTHFLNLFLILHFDHGGGNLSTAIAKYVASGQGSISQALAAGMIALKTPLHGGACKEAFSFIQEASQLENPSDLIYQRLDEKKVIPGFGHRVLRKEDPRAFLLKNYCEEHLPKHRLVETARKLYQEIPTILVTKTNTRNPHANIDFFSGITLHAAGFSPEYFSLIFGFARMSGGILNQILDEKKEKVSLHRPESIYTGPGGDELISIPSISTEHLVIAFNQLAHLKTALNHQDNDLFKPLNQFTLHLQKLYEETEQLRPLEQQYYQAILSSIEKERLEFAVRLFYQFEFENLAKNLLSKTEEAARAGSCSFRFYQELNLEFKILSEQAFLLGSSQFSILRDRFSSLSSQIRVRPSLKNFEKEIHSAFDYTQEDQMLFLYDLFEKMERHLSEDWFVAPTNLLAGLLEEIENETIPPKESFMNPAILLKLLTTSFLKEEEKSEMIHNYLSRLPVPSSIVIDLLEGIHSPGSTQGIALMLDRLSAIRGVREHEIVHENYEQQPWHRVRRS